MHFSRLQLQVFWSQGRVLVCSALTATWEHRQHTEGLSLSGVKYQLRSQPGACIRSEKAAVTVKDSLLDRKRHLEPMFGSRGENCCKIRVVGHMSKADRQKDIAEGCVWYDRDDLNRGQEAESLWISELVSSFSSCGLLMLLLQQLLNTALIGFIEPLLCVLRWGF